MKMVISYFDNILNSEGTFNIYIYNYAIERERERAPEVLEGAVSCYISE